MATPISRPLMPLLSVAIWERTSRDSVTTALDLGPCLCDNLGILWPRAVNLT
jgi:hypothetical protein